MVWGSVWEGRDGFSGHVFEGLRWVCAVDGDGEELAVIGALGDGALAARWEGAEVFGGGLSRGVAGDVAGGAVRLKSGGLCGVGAHVKIPDP